MTSCAKPLRERIVGALRLQPMTVEQLAACLGVSRNTIRRCLPDAKVRQAGTVRGPGRPWNRWELAA